MNRERAEDLFIALARLSYPLERACEKTLDTIKDDVVSDRKQEYIRDASKDLLRGFITLRMELREAHPDLDFDGEGRDRYKKIRRKYEDHL